MALNTRELYLVLKARDEASRTIRAFGGNVGKLGALQAKLNAAEQSAMARNTAARRRAAAAQVEVEKAKATKLAEISRAQRVLDDQAILKASERSAAIVRNAEREILAAKARGDANIAAARKTAEAAKLEQAAIARSSAAQVAGARRAIRSQNIATQAAHKRLAMGSGMMTAGVTGLAIGAIGLAGLNKATNAAVEYNHEVAKTKTQTDKVRVSMAQLAQMGISTATSMAVDFKKVQPTLYDIFSSIDVKAPQAAMLLRAMGKASVAGAADMQVASRATVGILNAYKLKATAVTHVNDVMFQLVRKGVGTYKQFTETIGRSVPSAIKANQSIENLSGMLAFLTRNGLSAAMASASAGRALDALANPKSVYAFKHLGLAAKDALDELGGKPVEAKLLKAGINYKKFSVDILNSKGDIRPVVDIMRDLNKEFVGLTKEQKAGIIQKAFKGSGGTIQAMRFFNHALNDGDNSLAKLTASMFDAKGATAEAYKTMSNTPAAKIQLMKNRFHALSITIGNDLIPAKLKLVEILSKIVGWFDKLSPAVKKTIAYIAGFVAITLVIVGILAVLAGMMTTISAAVVLLGANLATAAIAFGAFIAIAAGIYLIIKYHKEIGKVVSEVWGKLKYVFAPVMSAWNEVYPVIRKGVDKIVTAFTDLLTVFQHNKKSIDEVFKFIKDVVQTSMDIIVRAIKIGWPIISSVVAAAIGTLKTLIGIALVIFSGLTKAWNLLPDSAKQIAVALAIVYFALRNTVIAAALIGPAIGLIGTRFAGAAALLKGGLGLLKIALISLGVGLLIGNLTKHSNTAVKTLGVLASAGAGAAIGFSMGGPWGAAIGGLLGGFGALIKAFGDSDTAASLASKSAARSLKIEQDAAIDLLNTLKQVNGTYAKGTRASAVNSLQKTGVLDKAAKYGLDPSVVTDASLGNSKAMLLVEKQLADYSLSHLNMTDKQSTAFAQFYKDIRGVTRGLLDGEKAYEIYKNALKEGLVSQKNLDKGAKSLSKTLKNTGTGLYNPKGTSSSSNTAYSVRNTAMVKAYLDNIKAVTTAELAHGESAAVATAGYNKKVAAIKSTLLQMGFEKDQVNAIIALYGKIPPSVAATIKADAGPAKREITGLIKIANNIRQHKIPSINIKTAKGKAALAHVQKLIADLRQLSPTQIAANPAKAKATLADAQKLINGLKQSKIPGVKALIKGLQADLKTAQATINNLKGKNVTAGVNTTGLSPLQRAAQTLANLRSRAVTASIDTYNRVHQVKVAATGGWMKKARGAWVRGPGSETSDDIPAMLSNNEFVVRAKQAKKYPRLLEAINDDRPIKLAAGGYATGGTAYRRSYAGHIYSSPTSYANAVNSARQGASRVAQAIRDSLKNTYIPNLLSILTTASPTQIRRSMQSLYKAVFKAGDRVLDHYVSRNSSRLARYAGYRVSAQGRLDTAVASKNNLLSARSSLRGSVSSAVRGSFDITNELGSFADISGDLKNSVAEAKTFAAAIGKLKAKGYGPHVIADLYQKGPAALPTIEALLTATKGQAVAFTKNYSSLATIGSAVGKSVSGNLYDAGIRAADGLIRGLRSRLSLISRAMHHIATVMINTIKSRLGIRSPSKEFAWMGKMMMHGLHKGIDQNYSKVSNLLDSQSSDMLSHWRTPAVSGGSINPSVGSGNGGNRGGPVIKFEQGSIVTQEINASKHAADLGWEISRRVG